MIKPGGSAVQDQSSVVLASAGLQQLLLMLLALRMDPVGQLLAIEIQVCLLAHASRAWSLTLEGLSASLHDQLSPNQPLVAFSGRSAYPLEAGSLFLTGHYCAHVLTLV